MRLALVLLAAAYLGASAQVALAQGANTIGFYELVSQKRVTRTVWEYTYAASLTNHGPAMLKSAGATVASLTQHTTIVEGSLTFGDVPSSTTIRSTDTFVIRQDRLHPFDRSMLAWEMTWSQEAGPGGGILQFSNGVTLEVPPGAVDAATIISIDDLPGPEIDAILGNPAMTSNVTKRVLGGFITQPDSLTFKLPLRARVPVLPLEPGEVPLQILVQRNEQTYRYVATNLEYRGDEGVIYADVPGFSAVVIAGVNLTGEQIEEVCRTAHSFEPVLCTGAGVPDPRCVDGNDVVTRLTCNSFFPSVCYAVDPVQDPCCLIKRANRDLCPISQNCSCCRETLAKVVSSEFDVFAGGCQILGTDLSVEFPTCKLTETASAFDSSCPGLAITMAISPATMNLQVGETGRFYATITGRAGTSTVFQNVPVDPTWSSDAPQIAEFPNIQGGTIEGGKIIRGITASTSPVTVRARMPGSAIEATAEVLVTATEPPDPGQVRLTPDEAVVIGGEPATFTFSPVPPGYINWFPSFGDHAQCDDGTNRSCDFFGLNPCPPGVECVAFPVVQWHPYPGYDPGTAVRSLSPGSIELRRVPGSLWTGSQPVQACLRSPYQDERCDVATFVVVPDIRGQWSGTGGFLASGCRDPEDDGVHGISDWSIAFTQSVEPGTRVSNITGTFSGTGMGERVFGPLIGFMTEGGLVEGNAAYDSPTASGVATFSAFSGPREVHLDFLFQDTTGDTCSGNGSVTLTP